MMEMDLGAVYTKKYTAFRLWAPTADAVTLCLYREGDGDCLSDTLPMKRDVREPGRFGQTEICGMFIIHTVWRSGRPWSYRDPLAAELSV